jgi:hypothetical protein
MFIGLYLILSGSQLISTLWFFIPISVYSSVGNFAPFFEVGIGIYLDGRKRAQWLIPLLIFTFFYNIPKNKEKCLFPHGPYFLFL